MHDTPRTQMADINVQLISEQTRIAPQEVKEIITEGWDNNPLLENGIGRFQNLFPDEEFTCLYEIRGIREKNKPAEGYPEPKPNKIRNPHVIPLGQNLLKKTICTLQIVCNENNSKETLFNQDTLRLVFFITINQARVIIEELKYNGFITPTYRNNHKGFVFTRQAFEFTRVIIPKNSQELSEALDFYNAETAKLIRKYHKALYYLSLP